MVVIINKETDKKQIEYALKQIEKSRKKKKLIDFFGKLKGHFDDGLEYQRKFRDEWD